MVPINTTMLLFEFEEHLTPEAIYAIIQKDCKPFLAAIDNDIDANTMWRGAKAAPRAQPILRKQARLDNRSHRLSGRLVH